MPNWCCGVVQISGKAEDVENFCKLFVYDDEEGNKDGEYFYRSFIFQDWKDFWENKKGKEDIELFVNFAWSAYSCIIEERGGKSITLEEACKKYNVSVIIDTEEPRIGFIEHIECNENGLLMNECKDMVEFKCKGCGETCIFSPEYSVEDLESEECWHCEKQCGWEVAE